MSDATRGQQNRKEIVRTIEPNLSHYCLNTLPKMANLIAYDYNLSPDTLRYKYIPMWIDVGILEYNNDNQLVLSSRGQHLQTTSDSLTEEQLQQELEEENEARNQLGKKPVSLQEWKKIRSKRIKPIAKE